MNMVAAATMDIMRRMFKMYGKQAGFGLAPIWPMSTTTAVVIPALISPEHLHFPVCFLLISVPPNLQIPPILELGISWTNKIQIAGQLGPHPSRLSNPVSILTPQPTCWSLFRIHFLATTTAR